MGSISGRHCFARRAVVNVHGILMLISGFSGPTIPSAFSCCRFFIASVLLFDINTINYRYTQARSMASSDALPNNVHDDLDASSSSLEEGEIRSPEKERRYLDSISAQNLSLEKCGISPISKLEEAGSPEKMRLSPLPKLEGSLVGWKKLLLCNGSFPLSFIPSFYPSL